MILTDYYLFEKKPGQISKMRMDCTTSTQSYNPFEALRNKRGELFVYVGDNTYTEAGERGKSIGNGQTHGGRHNRIDR